MSKETAFILIRWVIALTFLIKGSFILAGAAGGEGGGFAGAAAYAMFAFALVISGVLLTTRELVPWVSAPIWRFITGLVFPDDKFDRPPVNYALARSYRQQQRLDDAIEEYLKIVASSSAGTGRLSRGHGGHGGGGRRRGSPQVGSDRTEEAALEGRQARGAGEDGRAARVIPCTGELISFEWSAQSSVRSPHGVPAL